MAKIGLSKPMYAAYTYSNGSVTYGTPAVIGKYTEMQISVNNADANILYGDNAPAESDKSFTGGSFSMQTTDFDATAMQAILGVTADTSGWMAFGDAQSIPYLGMAGIIKKRVNGTDKWVAFVLPKVQFNNPSISAVTQGESIDWQTQELEATILRDDTTSHNWKMISTEQESEAAAMALINTFFGVTSGTATT